MVYPGFDFSHSRTRSRRADDRFAPAGRLSSISAIRAAKGNDRSVAMALSSSRNASSTEKLVR